jgi:dTMP kinase
VSTSCGFFIVVESLDGVGKTTLVRNLAAVVGGQAMNTPGNELRPVVGTVLDALGEDQDARCLFYAASVRAAGTRARRIADAGGIVVMDRYWLSTIAYARARGVGADLTGVERMIPRPDLTLLLTLDEVERQRRLLGRGNVTPADIETLDPRFRATVLSEMRAAHRDSSLRPIDVDLTGRDERAAAATVLDVVRRSVLQRPFLAIPTVVLRNDSARSFR